MVRKVDAYLEEKPAQHGKKPNHKLKPYVVLQYLLKYTDENLPPIPDRDRRFAILMEIGVCRAFAAKPRSLLPGRRYVPPRLLPGEKLAKIFDF